MDAMRQAFFKRQAKRFFDNEAEQQAYIEHAEKEYLEATVTLKDILFNSKNDTQKVNKGGFIREVWGGNAMTPVLNNMTQAEFDEQMAEIKERNPNLFQFIADFVDRKVSTEEVDEFLKMERTDQVDYIKNYKARA